MAWSMSTALCLMTWNVAIGRSNCTRTLAYSTARSWACSIDAEQLGAEGDGGVVDDAPPDARCGRRRGRPRSAASSVEVEPGDPAGEVPGRHGLALGRLDAGTCRCPPGCGRRPAPSRRCAPSSTTGFSAVSRHWPPLRLARVRIRSTGSPWPSSSRAMVPRVAPAASDRELVVEAEPSGRERGEHGRGQERPGERHPTHLLEHDHQVDQAQPEPALGLGHQQAGPAELDELGPDVVGGADARRPSSPARSADGLSWPGRPGPSPAGRPGRR